MRSPDIVAEFVSLARDVAGVGPQAAARLEDEMRRSFGGLQVRIAPRPPVTVEQINAELRAGKVVRVIADDFGVSRATIYRHLKKKVAKHGRTATAQ